MMHNKKVSKGVSALVLAVATAVSTLLSWPGFIQAQLNPPTANGMALAPSEAPCVPFTVGPSTGTAEALVRSSGPGYLSWAVLGTGPISAELGVYGTSVIGSGAIAESFRTLPPLVYSGSTDSGKHEWTFIPPMRFTSGLAIKMNSASTWATVCTRLYGTSNP